MHVLGAWEFVVGFGVPKLGRVVFEDFLVDKSKLGLVSSILPSLLSFSKVAPYILLFKTKKRNKF